MKLVNGLAAAGVLSWFLVTGCAATDQVSNSDVKAQARTYSYDVNDQCYYTSDCYSVQVGSPEVSTSRLAPYHAVWTQDAPNEGEWVRTQATFEEMLSVGSDGQWVHIQKNHLGNGMVKIDTRRLDRKTLQVLDLTIEFENAPPEQPAKVYYDMTGDSFAADVTFADGRKVTGQARDLAMPMFDGQIAGLTIAALPLADGYVATLPMVIPNLGIYWIEVSVVGKKEIQAGDAKSIPVWEVNANWLNLTDGDIYEPGRGGDGGVYYIAVNPGDGVPPVIEYANSGTIIAWDGIRRE